MKRNLFLATLLLLVGADQALAGGYEKNVLWGARTAGIAGAATSTVSGADALYFNPAGMISDKGGQQVSANFSPTWATFTGSTTADNAQASNTQFFPIASVLYSNMINDKVALGVGYYVSGGSKSEYDNQVFTPGAGAAFGMTPKLEADIELTEFSLGVAYKLMPGLKIGAAWRLAMVKAEFASAGYVPGTGNTFLLASDMHDLKQTRWDGYRLGVQYAPEKTWGLGLNYRSSMNFTAKGTQDVTVYNNGTQIAATGGDVQANTTFPMQLSLGGHYDVSEAWRLYGEYVYTQYSQDAEVLIGGNYTVGGAPKTNTNIQQRWSDQHNFRIAAECKSFDWPIRFGYVYSVEPENKNYSLPTLAAPGNGHTFAIGTGHSFLTDALDFNTAFVYDTVATTLANNSATNTSPPTFAGNQATSAYSLHFSLAYNF